MNILEELLDICNNLKKKFSLAYLIVRVHVVYKICIH